jgi:hypothetical protein
MSLDLAKVEEMAPDQSALSAARKLLAPQGWPTLAADDQGLVWGECQGSGSLPYRVVLSEPDLGYKCTCPSRKFPCKHTLALMWMRAEKRAFATGEERPDWVKDWLARRRGGAARVTPGAGQPKQAASIAATAEEATAEPADPKAEARAAAQRERNRAEREASILAGIDELERWILDQVGRGLAHFQAVAQQQCLLVARRLVDAKAGGLAARLENLPGAMFAIPEPRRAGFLIEKLGELHLIAEAYRRQAELPAALGADIRACVGWTTSREALVADAQALRLRDRFMVLATLAEIQPDNLRRLETWLARLGDGEGPRFATLVDFVPVSTGARGSTYAPGESFEAELVFHPSAAPLRAVVAEQFGSATRDSNAVWTMRPCDVAAALDEYEEKLALRPWLGEWPIAVTDAIIAPMGETFVLTHPGGGEALPVKPRGDDMILPLVGLAGIQAFGLWDGRRLDLQYAETPLGRWLAA